MTFEMTCPICQRTFTAEHGSAKYCSDRCRDIAKQRTQKAWRKAHPNYHKEWKEKNPGYYLEYARAYRKAQKERDEAINKLIKKENRND